MALRELSAAYECFESDYQDGQNLKADKYMYSVPGGMVTVHLTEGKAIQIVDVRILSIEY